MIVSRAPLRAILLAMLLLVGPVPVICAQTPSDTAAVILSVARALQRDGKIEASRELLRFLRSHFAASAAARSADSLLEQTPGTPPTGAGRNGFVTFNTLYGGFLGLATAAALGAEGSGEAGAGLLLGAPLGFFLSRAIARRNFHTAGQAGIASFATVWGTWLGLGIQQVFDIGESEFCSLDFCSTSTSDTAPWGAMVLGGLTGIGVGWSIGSKHEIRPGTSTLIAHSAFWGSWFGLSLGRVAGLEDDGLFTSVLGAGNAALLAAIPASKAWRPSSSRVRLITAAGLAGGLAGVGISLIANPDDDRVALAIPAATSAVGLLIGAAATRHQRDLDSPDGLGPGANALVQWRDGLHFGAVLPEPAVFRVERRDSSLKTVRGVRIRLFDARF
jgi:uncharacterized protein YqgC (DUF456 family)